MTHVPVLVGETVSIIDPVPGGFYIDATLGLGGHSMAILTKQPAAAVVGIDVDPSAIKGATENLKNFGPRFEAIRGNYRDILSVVERFGPADGIVADLGLSSLQLSDDSRGFSFAAEGPLDMRMDPSLPRSAADVLNKFPEDELVGIFREYGDERFAPRIARAVAAARVSRPFALAREFAEFVSSVSPRVRGGIHPATRVFQALRIYVNSELQNLDVLLKALPSSLKSGGRAVVISFHSKEDGAVKRSFKTMSSDGIARVLTKKPIMPSDAEVKSNPRSRSAKLRAVEKL